MVKPNLYARCKRCGRKLTTPLAKQRGYGKCCWEKIEIEHKSTRKTIFQILSENITNKEINM